MTKTLLPNKPVNARKSVPKILGDNMTPLQAKKRFLALMKPYWLKDLKESRGPKLSHKQYLAKYGEERKERIFYDAYLEDWEWWDYHVKTVQSGKYADADIYGDTVLREALPHSYWAFINYLPIKWEGSEKYDDDPYDLENLYDDETHACIVDGEPSWEDYSTADKRVGIPTKLAAKNTLILGIKLQANIALKSFIETRHQELIADIVDPLSRP
jgi:hypothetical protein